MKNILTPILNLFRFHKMKFAAVLLFALLFAVLFFPFDDLSDLVTAKISEATGGAWYVQFDKMRLGLFPPGVNADDVIIESTSLPALNAKSLAIKPWILGAIMAKTGVGIDAGDIFKGNVSVDYKEGEKLATGERMQDIALIATDISLAQLFDYLRNGNIANMVMQGSLAAQSSLRLDPSFKTQPTGDVAMHVAGLTLPNPAINVPAMGPIQLPTLKLGKLNMQSKVKDGKINIDDLTFGGPNDDLSGKIKGELSVAFARDPGGVRPVLGAYNLSFDLSVKKSFFDANSKSAMGLAFAYIEGFKQDTPQGPRYVFTASAPNFQMQPQLTKAKPEAH